MATPLLSTETLPEPPLGRYGDLAKQIRARGLLSPRPWSYTGHAGMVVGAFAAVVVAMLLLRGSWWLLLLAPVLAVVATQMDFLGHDVGHLQVTRNVARSRLLGLVVGDLLGGLSFGWWVTKHNAHHAHPNDLEKDPDVAAGIFVFDEEQMAERRGFSAWVGQYQAFFFFPLLLAEAVNLHVSSVKWLFEPGQRYRVAEAILLFAHFVLYVGFLLVVFSWPQALVFAAIHKGAQGLYLGSSFAPSHKGMPVLSEEQAQDPLLRQVLTSRNVRGGHFIAMTFGGLNYQIEHHLFPSMPRANLRHAQPIVQQFCEEHRISYAEYSLFESYAAAMGHLNRVGATERETVGATAAATTSSQGG